MSTTQAQPDFEKKRVCVQGLLKSMVGGGVDGSWREPILKKISACFDGLNKNEKYDLLAVNDEGRTALWWAVETNNLSVANLLLAGLAPDQKCKILEIHQRDFTALHEAVSCFHRNFKMAKLLLDDLSPEQKCRLLTITNSDGMTVLLYALWSNNRFNIIELLLNGLSVEQKYDIMKIHWFGVTALYWAVYNDDLDVATLLLKGLSVEQKYTILKINRQDQAAFYKALDNNNLKMVKLLLEDLRIDQKNEIMLITKGLLSNCQIDFQLVKILIEPLRMQKHQSDGYLQNRFKKQIQNSSPRNLLALFNFKNNEGKSFLEYVRKEYWYRPEIVDYYAQIEKEMLTQLLFQNRLPALPPNKPDVKFEFGNE